ncbi:MAG TPA: tRNA pseudouridine(55) synthase TruB, partial [Casimicrobiaceae bacterium]|nr:tRNA pseudouridine(55) synthase TruB [Casimicrobiaceae bacterium]
PIEALRFGQGQAVARTGLPDATYRVYTAEGFAGIAVAIEATVRPRRLTAGAASTAASDSTRASVGSGLV